MRFGFTIRTSFLFRRLPHLAPALPPCTWFIISSFVSLQTPVITFDFLNIAFVIYLHKCASFPLPLTLIQASLALFAFACVPEQDLGRMTSLKRNSDSSGQGNSFARCDAEFFVEFCAGLGCCRVYRAFEYFIPHGVFCCRGRLGFTICLMQHEAFAAPGGQATSSLLCARASTAARG